MGAASRPRAARDHDRRASRRTAVPQWVDVDLNAGRATLHDTQNGEQRTLPLAGKALEALRQLKLQHSARSEYLSPSPTVVLDPKTGKPHLDAPYEHFDAHWHAALTRTCSA